ncbi:hypothetical protein ACX6XY_03495 [Streptomyces sp. O3]
MAAAKLKLSEVRGDVTIGSTGAYSGTPHALRLVDGKWSPYCPTRAKSPFKSWGAAHEQKATLELCVKCSALVPTGPVTVAHEEVEIPGLGRTVTAKVVKPVEGSEGTTDKKEDAAMAQTATAEKTDPRDAQVEEIRASIERLPSLIIEGNAEGAETLKAEIEAAVSVLKGKGVAALKAQLRKERGEKIEAAEKERDTKGAEIATRETSTEAAEADEEIKKLVAKGSQRVKELAVNKFKGGHEIAEYIFDIRRRITTVDGVLDLNADTDAGRQLSGRVYDSLTENLPEEGEDEAADAIRAEIGSIRKSARNAMVDVRARYLKSLDHSPEEAKHWQHALDAHPDLKPSEAVAKFHGYELRTRAEIAKEAREAKKALEDKQKALAAKVEAGELSKEDAEKQLAEELSDGEKSGKEKATEAIEKIKKSAIRIAKSAKKTKDEVEREEILDALISAIADIRKEAKS